MHRIGIRQISLIVFFGALLAGGLSSCLLPGSDPTNAAPTKGAPVNIKYSVNPARYQYGSAITALTVNSDGSPVTRYAITPTTLPDGLSFDVTTGIISGTPTTITAAATYKVTASNSYGSGFVMLTLEVTDQAPTITFLAGTTDISATVGSAITTLTPTLGGGATTSCQAAPTLPAGLTLSSQCELSGTPTLAQDLVTYVISAINSGGSSSTSITITIIDIPPAFAFEQAPLTFTRGSAITPVTPTNTGGVIASCTVTPDLPTGLSLKSDCSITGTPTVISTVQTYTLTGTNNGGNANATVSFLIQDAAPDISFPNAITATLNVALTSVSPVNKGSLIDGCSVSPTLPTGLTMSTSCVLSGTPTATATSATYTVTATNSAGSGTATLMLAVGDVAPGLSYLQSNYVFTNQKPIVPLIPIPKGGTITSCTSSPFLPAGLIITPICAIGGTPTIKSAMANYVITGTNSGGSASVTITITINEVPPVIVYSPTSLTLNKSVTMSLAVPTNIGGAITACSASPALPAGLSLGTDCTISGTPALITASASYGITASNAVGTSTAPLTISITDTPPNFSYSGSPFSYTLNSTITTLTPTSTGGMIISCSSVPPLPAGLSLSSSCAISGTPTTLSSVMSYQITGNNSGGTNTANLSITVKDAIPAISYAGSPFSFIKSTAISTLTPVNTGGTVTDCSSNPTLPTGLTLSKTCVITGTPTVLSSSASYIISATNTGGVSQAVLTISVVDTAPSIVYSPASFTYTANSAITLTPTNSGGAITNCLSSPALPAGLSISKTSCAISGTPSSVSTATNYTITASNTGGNSSVVLSITIIDLSPAISFSPASVTLALRSPSPTITPSNTGGGVITSCTSSPDLPVGLNLSSTCVITGTPLAASSATLYRVTAANTGGSSSSAITLKVKDQTQIIFSSRAAINGTTSSSYNIWKVSLDGIDLVNLTSNTHPSLDSVYPSFSADGTTLLYSSLRSLNAATNGSTASSYNIWSATTTDNSQTDLTQNSNPSLDAIGTPVFSPDGSKIAFASKMALSGAANGAATSSSNIWIMNSDGTGKTALTSNSNSGLDSISPAFSANGTKIYFASLTATNGTTNGTAAFGYNIWSIKTDTTDLTRLTTVAPAMNYLDPTVSPDGNTVLFTGSIDLPGLPPTPVGSSNIWRMDSSNGGNPAPLTTTVPSSQDSKEARFSADGNYIVFVSKMPVSGTTPSSFNIWIMNSDGSAQKPLTTETAASLDSDSPSFSPDGSKIVFSSLMKIGGATTSSANIWMMNADGTSQTYFTGNTGANLGSVLTQSEVWYVPQ